MHASGSHVAAAMMFAAALCSTFPLRSEDSPTPSLEGMIRIGDDAPRYALSVQTPPPSSWPAAGVLRIAIGVAGPADYDLLTLTASGATLTRVRSGQAQVAAGAPRPDSDLPDLTVRRSTGFTDVIWGGRRVLTTFAPEAPRGSVLLGSSGPDVSVEDALIQPMSELRLEADFAAEGDVVAGWEVPLGRFRPTGVRSPRPRPEMAANPFTYAALGPAEALSVAGYWFWDGYEATVAAKGQSGGRLGICAYFRDPSHYVAFRWAAGDAVAQQGRQLVVVQGGQADTVACAEGGYVPDQWYRIGIRACRGYLEALIDGEVVLSARTDAMGQGAIGLWAEGAERAYFDDALVRRYEQVTEDFTGSASTTGGLWQRSGNAALVTGESDWRDTSVEATFDPDETSAGICFGWEGPWRMFAFRRVPGHGGQWQLVRIDGKREDLLWSMPAPPLPGSYRVRLETHGPYVTVGLGGQRVADYYDARLRGGRAGLYVVGGTGALRSARVCSADPIDTTPTITEQFTREASMSGWASPGGAWTAPAGPDRARFYRGLVFGDGLVEIELSQLSARTGSIDVALASEGLALDSGYRFTYSPMAGTQGELTLFRLGQVAASSAVRVEDPAGTHVLDLERRGNWLLASMDGQDLLSLHDPQPLHGAQIGYRVRDMSLDPRCIRVTAACLHDYTFSQAPTDWWSTSGVWEIHDRWKCFPGWAWFAGSGTEVPTLWSKRQLDGDQLVEVYCASIMDRADFPGYSHPGDLNLTICGDGQRLDSGYSVVLAGWNNRKTALLRRGRVVAENPSVRFNDPTNMNMGFHRHWFHVQVSKRGECVTVLVDGRPVITYDDPNPLPGGRVAVWAYKPGGGGILVARARLSAEHVSSAAGAAPAIGTERDPTDLPWSLYDHPADHGYLMVDAGPWRGSAGRAGPPCRTLDPC